MDANKNRDNTVIEQEFLEILQVNNASIRKADIKGFIKSEELKT